MSLTDHITAAFREHDVVLTCGTTVEEFIEAVEERAAIMEYDGGLSRVDAERSACRLLLGFVPKSLEE